MSDATLQCSTCSGQGTVPHVRATGRVKGRVRCPACLGLGFTSAPTRKEKPDLSHPREAWLRRKRRWTLPYSGERYPTMADVDIKVRAFTHGVLWTRGKTEVVDPVLYTERYVEAPTFRVFPVSALPAPRWGTVEGLVDVACGCLSEGSPYEGLAFYTRAPGKFVVTRDYWPAYPGNPRSAVIYSAASVAFVRYINRAGKHIPACLSDEAQHPIVEGRNSALIFFLLDFYHRREGHDHEDTDLARLGAWLGSP